MRRGFRRVPQSSALSCGLRVLRLRWSCLRASAHAQPFPVGSDWQVAAGHARDCPQKCVTPAVKHHARHVDTHNTALSVAMPTKLPAFDGVGFSGHVGAHLWG